jgi:hypothetical protein
LKKSFNAQQRSVTSFRFINHKTVFIHCITNSIQLKIFNDITYKVIIWCM